jgi:hypothetical protein
MRKQQITPPREKVSVSEKLQCLHDTEFWVLTYNLHHGRSQSKEIEANPSRMGSHNTSQLWEKPWSISWDSCPSPRRLQGMENRATLLTCQSLPNPAYSRDPPNPPNTHTHTYTHTHRGELLCVNLRVWEQ